MTGLWRGETPLILASASSIRKALAESAGISVHVQPAEVDERVAEMAIPGSAPADIAQALSVLKAEFVSRRYPGHYVLGADQTLDLAGQCLHKPATRQEAADQLARLAGRQHRLHSGMALAINGHAIWRCVETATLTTRNYSASFIHAYLDSAGDGVLRSVGAYQLEGLGVHLFEAIEGDHTIILGLPLLPLLKQLRNMGLMHG